MRIPKSIRDKFAAAGKKGGKSGDPNRKAAAMKKRMAEVSPEDRRSIARKAAQARWEKKGKA